MKKDNMILFYRGSESRIHKNGVGVLISDDSILPHIKSFEANNERLCYIILKGRIFNIGIIFCYGPTKYKEDEKKEDFLEELERTYDHYYHVNGGGESTKQNDLK